MKSVLMFVAVLAVACSSHDAGIPTSWDQVGVVGKTLERIDDDRVETFRFGSDGSVSATLGRRGGPVFAPLWYWRIEQGKLIMSESIGGEPEINMYNPRTNAGVLTVDRNMLQTARYSVQVP